MATKTWSGVTGDFGDASKWSPIGAPVSGDLAVINAGMVSIESTPTIAVQLTEAQGATAASTLVLANGTIDHFTELDTNDLNIYGAAAPTISISGTNTLVSSNNSFSGPKTTFIITPGSTFINDGTMNFYSSAPLMSGGGTFQNVGTMALLNPEAASQNAIIEDAVTGGGSIAMGRYARLEIAGSVGLSQTILLNGGASGYDYVQLDTVGTFAGVINGFSSSDLIAVPNISYTNATYTDTSLENGLLLYQPSGRLNLFNNGVLVGSINFSGSYALSSFTLTNNDVGGQSNLQITTTAVNQQSGGLPGDYIGSGGNPVYRFFNTVDGTQLITQSSAEAQEILSARPDLKPENNLFGAVPSIAPFAEPVYRFFEQSNGSHFLTASDTEFLGLTTPGTSTYRPDLSYEPGSTFFEDSVQQSGDVPVYRFFESVHGTELLTASQAEFQSLTTPGNGAYRPDLVPEGIAFYAPTGLYFG